jgi:hypothetical protein
MKTYSLLRTGIACAATFSCILVGCVTVTTHNHFPEQRTSNASSTVAQTASGTQCQCGANCNHHDQRYSYYPYPTDQGEPAGGRAYPPTVVYAPPGYSHYPNGCYPPTVVYAPPVNRGRYYPPVVVDPDTEAPATADGPVASSTPHVRRRTPRTGDQEPPQTTSDYPYTSDGSSIDRASENPAVRRRDQGPAVSSPSDYDRVDEIHPPARREDRPVADTRVPHDRVEANPQVLNNPRKVDRATDSVPVTGPVTTTVSATEQARRPARSGVPASESATARPSDVTVSESPSATATTPVGSSTPRSRRESITPPRNISTETSAGSSVSTPRTTERAAPASGGVSPEARRSERELPQTATAGSTDVTVTPQAASATPHSRRRTAPVATSTGTETPVAVEAQPATRKTVPAETVLVGSAETSADADVEEKRETVKSETPSASQGSAGSTPHSRRSQPR